MQVMDKATIFICSVNRSLKTARNTGTSSINPKMKGSTKEQKNQAMKQADKLLDMQQVKESDMASVCSDKKPRNKKRRNHENL